MVSGLLKISHSIHLPLIFKPFFNTQSHVYSSRWSATIRDILAFIKYCRWYKGMFLNTWSLMIVTSAPVSIIANISLSKTLMGAFKVTPCVLHVSNSCLE